MAQSDQLAHRLDEIREIINRVCSQHLDNDYQSFGHDLLEEFVSKYSKHEVLCRGKAESWAGGLLTAIARLNFLSDTQYPPSMTLKQLADACGVSGQTAAKKADQIGEVVTMSPYLGKYLKPEIQQIFQEAAAETFRDLVEQNQDLIRHALENAGDASLTDSIRIDFPLADRAPIVNRPPNRIRIISEETADDQNVPEVIYQIKIRLLGIEPSIWRRIQTPDMPLSVLSHAIEVAMGWESCHMHQFEFNKKVYGDPSFLEEVRDEYEYYLSDFLPHGSREQPKLLYLYDFGDSWEHEVKIEKQFASAPDEIWNGPICIEGENACPPEDCGGMWGYQDILDAKSDPAARDDYDGFIDLDLIKPEEFDLKSVNARLTAIHREEDEVVDN